MLKNLALFAIITCVSGLILNTPPNVQISELLTVSWEFDAFTDPATFTLYVANNETAFEVGTNIISSIGVTDFIVPNSLKVGVYNLLAADVALGGTGETIPSTAVLDESLSFDVSAPITSTGSFGSFPTGSLGSFPTRTTMKFTTPHVPEITEVPSEPVHENKRNSSLVGKIVGPIVGFIVACISVILCRRKLSRKTRPDGVQESDEGKDVPDTDANHLPVHYTSTSLPSDYNHFANMQQMGPMGNLHNLNQNYSYVPPPAEYNTTLSPMPSPNTSQDYQNDANHLPVLYPSIPQPSNHNYSAYIQQNTPLGNIHDTYLTHGYVPSHAE